MTDLSITAASVMPGSNATIEHGIFGATITAGQVVYLDDTTGRYKLADTDSATAGVRKPRGIALNGGGDGQPGAIVKGGDVTLGATIAAGVAYYLSGTPGGICPVADVAAGDHPAILGMGKSTTVLTVAIQAPDAVLA